MSFKLGFNFFQKKILRESRLLQYLQLNAQKLKVEILFPTNCALIYRDKIPVNYSPFNEAGGHQLFSLYSSYYFLSQWG